jgi:ankyrin repeat protein
MYDAFDLMETLLKSGANVNGSFKSDDKTPLYHAIFHGDIKALEILLEYGANPNLPNKKSALLKAIQDRRTKAIALLIENGAEINIKQRDPYYDDNETTPLFLATEKGEIQIVKVLLENGANPNIEVTNNKPIEIAIKKNRLDIALLLLSYNAVVNADITAKIVDLHGYDLSKTSLIHVVAVKIREHYKLDTNPEIIDQLPLPSPLKKALKHYEI